MKMIPTDPDNVVFKELPYRQKAKRIITALAVIIILLFILCVIFIVLFAMGKTKTQEEKGHEESVQKTCASKKCLFAAVGKLAVFFVKNFDSAVLFQFIVRMMPTKSYHRGLSGNTDKRT